MYNSPKICPDNRHIERERFSTFAVHRLDSSWYRHDKAEGLSVRNRGGDRAVQCASACGSTGTVATARWAHPGRKPKKGRQRLPFPEPFSLCAAKHFPYEERSEWQALYGFATAGFETPADLFIGIAWPGSRQQARMVSGNISSGVPGRITCDLLLHAKLALITGLAHILGLFKQLKFPLRQIRLAHLPVQAGEGVMDNATL
jgi:hypothetical protein